MDEYDTEDEGLDPDSEESDPIEEPVEGESIPRQQYEKVVKEARSLRTKLRRSELSTEFGKEIVELVPSSLTLKEQRELAAKLHQRLGATVETQNEQGTETDAEQAVEQPSEQEVRAAALARSGSGSASPTGPMSRDEWWGLYQSDPQKALDLARRGKVDKTLPEFPRPGGF